MECGWQESEAKELTIGDMKPEVFLAILNYIYTDHLKVGVLGLFVCPFEPHPRKLCCGLLDLPLLVVW